MSDFDIARGDQVIIHVPPGAGKDVKIVETEPKGRGQDITIQVSRERKVQVSPAIGVIVK